VGDVVPPLTVTAVRPGAGKPEPLELGEDLGRRAVAFVYFLTSFPVSEDIMVEVLAFVKKEAPGTLALYPVTRIPPEQGIPELAERLRKAGVEAPVILDQDGRVQRLLGVSVVPDIAVVDKGGVLCFRHAVTLRQKVFAEIDVAEALRLAARGEEVPVRDRIDRYYPAEDLVGRSYLDAALPERGGGRLVKLSEHVKPGKLTAILYWSPRCRFSKRAMAGFVNAHRDQGRFVEILSVARSGEDDEVRRYAEQAGIAFPILEDRDRSFSRPYRILTTPTLIIVRPDGVIDSVYTTGTANYYAVLGARIRAILNPRPPARPRPAGAAPTSGG
jgi:hypothetical protein